MRLATVQAGGRRAIAVKDGDRIVNLTAAAPEMGDSLKQLLAGGDAALQRAAEAARRAPASATLEEGKFTWLPLIQDPNKILCLGLNYAEHAFEGGREKPDYPIYFVRFTTTLVAHEAPMIRPLCSERFDWEGEMAVIIGKRARHLTLENALSCVAGYSVFNDGSVRDYQRKTSQWTVGKNFDGSGGFGPWLVTADELPPGAVGLHLQTRINGEVMQDANTRDMIFNVAEAIATVTEVLTLEPGDVIASGTPSGVGDFRKPPVYMRHGDVCEIEIERIGLLRNPIVDEGK
jgi:acylpyruvate hydrolase